MLRRLLPLAFLALFAVLPSSHDADGASGRLCEARGICHKVVHACSQQVNTQILNVGTSSWTIPTSVTVLSKVSAIGAGGGADNGGFGGTAGAGGAYSEVDNLAVTPGNTLALSIGVHGPGGAASASGLAGAAGGDTSVSYLGSQILLAKGGGGAGNGTTATGGQAASGVGTIKTSGGNGGNGGNGGGGGGGAGGPHGDGVAGGDGAPGGAPGPPYPGGNGGAGDAGFGGAGGLGSTQNNVDGLPGSSGKEFGTAGSGGGGGGGVGGAVQQSNAGATGSFGAGGAGTGFGAATFPAGRDGTDGVVAVQYTLCGTTPPPPPQNTFFVATNGNDSNAGTFSAPFLTFGQCQAAMRNSSTTKTCTIRAGTYNFASQFSLTQADAGTTWQYYSGDGVNTAVIDGGGTVDLFSVTGANITLNGIKMQNPRDYAVVGGSAAGITIKNSDIGFNHDSFECCGGFAGIITLDNVTNLTVSHNYVHDTQAQGIRISAFAAGGTMNGTVVDGNVALNTCQVINDCGAIYFDARFSNLTAGNVAITNNFIRDYGNSGLEAEGIYLDDDTSNATVSGNIVGPMNAGNGGNSSDTIINGGTNNTFSNNIFDLGATSHELIGRASSPGDGGSILFNWGTLKNVWQNNIVVSNYAGATTTNGGIEYLTSTNYPTANGTITTNAYHNYGGGAETTTGNVLSDASPQHLSAAQLGLACPNGIYAIAPGSAVLSAPVSFQQIVGGWGPPGFVIPSSTNHSCGTSTGTLPSLIEAYWYWGFPTDNGLTSPSIATTQANAPASQYAAWFSAIGTGAGDGHITFTGVGTPSASDITAWKNAGKFMSLTIGGSASNTGQPNALLLTNGTQEANMLADIKTAVTNFGFQGVDMDLENDTGQWNNTEMCQLFTDLKAFYGSTFIVGIAPAPYQLRSGGVYLSLFNQCGANIDLIEPQWYSQPGQTDSFFINSYIGPDLSTFINTEGIPSTKILIGASDNFGDGGAPGGPSTYCTAYKNWINANPTKPLRGFIWFQSASDQQEATPWSYASTIKTCLGL